jgi:hypothetical protein
MPSIDMDFSSRHVRIEHSERSPLLNILAAGGVSTRKRLRVADTSFSERSPS